MGNGSLREGKKGGSDKRKEEALMTFFYTCRAVALYFIDKLALRAGNEKDTDESADTVGCCSLRVEHISKS